MRHIYVINSIQACDRGVSSIEDIFLDQKEEILKVIGANRGDRSTFSDQKFRKFDSLARFQKQENEIKIIGGKSFSASGSRFMP